jgi:hypothetical protein
VLLALSLAGAEPAAAIDLEIGEFTGSLDTTVSVGASMRVEDRECDLIYQGHGGCSADPFWINADDGDLNYDQWNFYSAAVKATTELEISRDNLGAFVRATAFYDAVANDRDPQRTDLDRDARYRTSPINSGVVGLGFLLLDAYLFGDFELGERLLQGDFELGERLLQARAGNQVVSWGESLFTPGGIAQTNAFDITRLRVPGSELKEAFVPAPMAWVSLDLSASLGLEAYYQVYWNRTQIDPTGSYFSTNDLVGRGAQGLFLPVLNPRPDPSLPADPSPCRRDQCREETAEELFAKFLAVPKRGDEEPNDHGQGGVALRYYAAPIRSEFGLYYLRYHSKTPAVGFESQFPFPLTGTLRGYYREYAEDIDLYGVSVSTEILNVAVGAELSYRPDDPVPIAANGRAFLNALAAAGNPVRTSGFVTERRVQGLLNGIWTLGPGTRLLGPVVGLLGADDITVIGEVGFVDYDLSHEDDFRQENEQVPPFFRDQGQVTDYAAPGTSPGVARSRVDEFSWGYQLLVQPTYTNPFGVPITVTPRLGFQHDVNGNTPGMLPFIEDRKAITLGVDVDYLNTWGLDLSYAAFFGAGRSNLSRDRDFVSLSLSYSF